MPPGCPTKRLAFPLRSDRCSRSSKRRAACAISGSSRSCRGVRAAARRQPCARRAHRRGADRMAAGRRGARSEVRPPLPGLGPVMGFTDRRSARLPGCRRAAEPARRRSTRTARRKDRLRVSMARRTGDSSAGEGDPGRASARVPSGPRRPLAGADGDVRAPAGAACGAPRTARGRSRPRAFAAEVHAVRKLGADGPAESAASKDCRVALRHRGAGAARILKRCGDPLAKRLLTARGKSPRCIRRASHPA